jgi:light-regulated signal transduction histidine kinase (bacteriophytochrome)
MIHLTQRMDALIDSLLQFSRLGRVDMARQSTDVDHIVDDIVDTLSEALQRDNVAIRRPHDLPEVVCDTVRTGEVFRNLITNAVKYNNKDDRWIEIGVDQSGAVPVFYVKDNGIGIPEKHQAKVFEVFKRLHGRDKYGGGTGAGLAIVEKIVAMHGGRIWLESEKGVGSTFFLTLSPEEEEDLAA